MELVKSGKLGIGGFAVCSFCYALGSLARRRGRSSGILCRMNAVSLVPDHLNWAWAQLNALQRSRAADSRSADLHVVRSAWNSALAQTALPELVVMLGLVVAEIPNARAGNIHSHNAVLENCVREACHMLLEASAEPRVASAERVSCRDVAFRALSLFSTIRDAEMLVRFAPDGSLEPWGEVRSWLAACDSACSKNAVGNDSPIYATLTALAANRKVHALVQSEAVLAIDSTPNAIANRYLQSLLACVEGDTWVEVASALAVRNALAAEYAGRVHALVSTFDPRVSSGTLNVRLSDLHAWLATLGIDADFT
jgi:hypothetical protein